MCSRGARGAACAYSSSAWRALSGRSLGTTTSTVTSRSPGAPSRRGTPLPRTRRVRPLGVPGGTRTVTEPSSVGTVRSTPLTASGNVIGTASVRSSPYRPNRLSSRTLISTYRSPAGPPRAPGSPRPDSRIFWPSATPAGIRTLSVRALVTPPVPRHSGHFTSTIVPTPWHSRQGSEKLNEPWLIVVNPTPWQTGQVRGTDPGLAPLPWQVSQTPGARRVSGSVAPLTASRKSSSTSASTSRPRLGPRRVAVRPPPEKIELNRSEKPAPPNRRSPAPGPAFESPNRSDRSNAVPPPPRGPRRNAPDPKSWRISSYSLRCLSSDSTSYASDTALNRSSACALPGLWSGCSSRASFRYAFLTSSAEADLLIPSTA